MRAPFDPLPKAMEGDQGYQQKSRVSAIFPKKLTTTFDPLEYIKSINMVIKEPISFEGDQNWCGKRLRCSGSLPRPGALWISVLR